MSGSSSPLLTPTTPPSSNNTLKDSLPVVCIIIYFTPVVVFSEFLEFRVLVIRLLWNATVQCSYGLEIWTKFAKSLTITVVFSFWIQASLVRNLTQTASSIASNIPISVPLSARLICCFCVFISTNRYSSTNIIKRQCKYADSYYASHCDRIRLWCRQS